MNEELARQMREAFPEAPLPARPVTGHRCLECDEADALLGGRPWPAVAADFPGQCHDVFHLLTPQPSGEVLDLGFLVCIDTNCARGGWLSGMTVDPSAVERLLAERAVVCWLHLYHLENTYARRDSTPLDLGMYFQKAIDRANKRYLTALKALAEVRRLAVPAVQVNIARRQVNIAGAG